jgi:predicted dehydrogenase
MTDKKRAAVIGVGLLGARHSQELAEDQRVELVAAADLRQEKADEIAAKWSCRAYNDYEEMLRTESPDIVVVATPDPFHRDPVVACAQAGVPHILLQKPMATTVADAEAMMAAAQDGGSQIYVIFATRWFAANLATHYAFRSGLVGDVVYGEVLTDDSITVPLEMWGARDQTWADTSSTAHFLHSHLVDRLRWYLSPAEVTQVYAMEQRSVLGFAPDLYDSFLFFDNGFKARVKTGWIHYIETGVENRSVYNATRGQIINNTSPAFGLSMGWRVSVSDDTPLSALEECQQALLKKGLTSRIISREPRNTGWARGIRRGLELELDGCARPNPTTVILDGIFEGTLTPKAWQEWQGEGPLPTGEDGLAQTKIVCAVVESARTGEIVKL